nr:hypothetical protein [uncultured Acidocella sp.]
MNWLSQNWIWIAVAVGAFFFMTRMGGCGMGRSMQRSRGRGQSDSSDAAPRSGTAVDPVSRHSIGQEKAISSVYRHQAYYFENRENRDAFEADPERYLSGMAVAGEEMNDGGDNSRQRHQRHGC